MSPDSRHPHTPQDTPPQLPLPDIHYDTQLTLWDNVDLDALGVSESRARSIAEMRPADRMMLALSMEGLTPIERIVNAGLAFHGWLSFPGLDLLEIELGIAKRHITTAIKALQEKTGLRKFRKGRAHGEKDFQYAFAGMAVLDAIGAKATRKKAVIARNSESRSHESFGKEIIPKNSVRNSETRSYENGRDSETRSHEALRDSEFRNITGKEPESIVVVTNNNISISGSNSGSAPQQKSETRPAPGREPVTPPPDWWQDFERRLAQVLLVSPRPPDFVAISEKAALAGWGEKVLQETARRMVETYQGRKVSDTTAVFLKIAVSVASDLTRAPVPAGGSSGRKYRDDKERWTGRSSGDDLARRGGGRRGS